MIPIHDDNPIRIMPFVTVGMIAACVLVFLWQLSLGPRQAEAFVYAFGMIPAVLLDLRELPANLQLLPAEATLFTSMFMHGGWMHLIGNMVYLWIFGNNIEDQLGHTRFVVFYLLCGVAAAAAQILPEPGSTIPMIGASGAISGVLGAYLLLFPHARVLVIVPLGVVLYPMRVSAALVLGLWFLVQIGSALIAPADQGGVAWWAHVGGFVAGMLLIHPMRMGAPVHAGARRKGPWG